MTSHTRMLIKLDQGVDKDQTPGPLVGMSTTQDWVSSFMSKRDIFSFEEPKAVDETCREISRNFSSNITHAGFIHYLHLCWASEVGCELRPDMIWYTIVSEVAALVLDNPEYFKHLFNDSTVKKDITIASGSAIIDADLLVEAIRFVIKDPEFLSTICDTRFESEVPNANYAIKMAFACMATPYFNYMNTMCGIPHLELVGSEQDWNKLYNAIDSLTKYVPDVSEDTMRQEFYIISYRKRYLEWIDLCRRVVANILHYAFKTPIELECLMYYSKEEFFSNIFHYGKNTECGSGHPDNIVLGWAKYFYRQGKEADLSQFSPQVTYVPYTDADNGKVYCQVTTLSHSEKDEDTNVLRPQYGIINYEILDDDKANEIINPERKDSHGRKYQPLSKKKLLEIVSQGRYYKPASVHYKRLDNSGICCDRCRKYDVDECIGHHKLDLCMKCATELATEYNVKLPNTNMDDLVKTDEHGTTYIVATAEELNDICKKGKRIVPFCYLCRTYNINEYVAYNGKLLCIPCVDKI